MPWRRKTDPSRSRTGRTRHRDPLVLHAARAGRRRGPQSGEQRAWYVQPAERVLSLIGNRSIVIKEMVGMLPTWFAALAVALTFVVQQTSKAEQEHARLVDEVTRLVQVLDLHPGSVVADVGAGSGEV